jgi:hypothetical protein
MALNRLKNGCGTTTTKPPNESPASTIHTKQLMVAHHYQLPRQCQQPTLQRSKRIFGKYLYGWFLWNQHNLQFLNPNN